jgi:hypothetical protein
MTMTDNTIASPETKPHALIASDRVEGTVVRRPNGDKVGAIERLMIDKLSGKVAYAVLSFGGFLRLGEKHLPIPWERLKYDPAIGAYAIDITDDELAKALLRGRQGVRLGRPQQRACANDFYQARPYWGI